MLSGLFDAPILAYRGRNEQSDAHQKLNQLAGRGESNGVSKQANGMSEHFLKNRCQIFMESFVGYFGFLFKSSCSFDSGIAMLRLFEFLNAQIANKAGLCPRAVTHCAIWGAQMGDKICKT